MKNKQTRSKRGYFKPRDPHPLFKDYLFVSYVKNRRRADGTYPEYWKHKSKLPTLTREESLKERFPGQTGSAKGYF